MFEIFTRARSPKAARSPIKYARLSLEALESRFCPSAPTLYNLTAAAIANHHVRVSGTLTADYSSTITLTGAVTGQLTSGSGNFSFVNNGSSGLVTLVAVDQIGQSSNPATVTVNNPSSPTITNFTVTLGNQRTITVSGQVNSVDLAGRYVSLSGILTNTVVTNASGIFTLTTSVYSLGTVNANFSDNWGQSTTATTEAINKAPAISNFLAVAGPNNGWTFSGTVTDEGPKNLAVTFAGLPELQGQKVYVDAQGNFSFSVVINPIEHGTVSVLTTDWWGLNSNTAYTFVN